MPATDLLPDEKPADCPVCQKIVPISPSEAGDAVCPFCGTLVWVMPGKRLAKRLANYRLSKRIGQNRFLAVSDEEQVVQVHVLPTSLSRYQDFVDRWESEIAIASGWNHPNLAPIVDHGCFRGHHYVVFDYVGGGTAARILQEHGAMPLRFAVHLIRGCCRGLTFLHAQEIVHRGLSPESIAIGRDKQVRITACGLTGVLDEVDGPITRSGIGIGIEASHYSAPEVWSRAAKASCRSDIYALGMCFYHFVTGEHAFATDSLKGMLMTRMTSGAAPIRTVKPDLPEHIAGLIDQMVAVDPNGRPLSAWEVLEVLEH